MIDLQSTGPPLEGCWKTPYKWVVRLDRDSRSW